MKRGVFVTGTDTGVGKTFASCALLHALRARGESPLPMKPIAAGAELREGRWTNDDTGRLMEAAGLEVTWASRVTPVLLRAAMAPHIAALQAEHSWSALAASTVDLVNELQPARGWS